jgi:uncharacterized protein (AIM24 family)
MNVIDYQILGADIQIELDLTRQIGAGLFGSEGFILQRLAGDGPAFLYGGGAIVQRGLSAGRTPRVNTGCLIAFSKSVDFYSEFVGGFRNALFGGEGIFLARLTGPGVVYLQSRVRDKLADRIVAASRLPCEPAAARGRTG